MIANRFKPMGLVAIGMVAAMGFYLISSRVASERTELEKVDRRIIATQKAIRQLQTEIGTRASMRQLERWNGDVLALTSPDASQYIAEGALAHIDRSGITDGPRFMPQQMVTAMANTPTMADAVPAVASDAGEASATIERVALITQAGKPATVVPVKAVAVRPEPAKTAKIAAAKSSQPKAAKPMRIVAMASAERATPRKTAAVAKIERKLLDDRLLGELAQAARAEEKRR